MGTKITIVCDNAGCQFNKDLRCNADQIVVSSKQVCDWPYRDYAICETETITKGV